MERGPASSIDYVVSTTMLYEKIFFRLNPHAYHRILSSSSMKEKKKKNAVRKIAVIYEHKEVKYKQCSPFS